MRFYKEIRFCRICKTRFVIEHGRTKKFYCDNCQKKYNNYKKLKEEKENGRNC